MRPSVKFALPLEVQRVACPYLHSRFLEALCQGESLCLAQGMIARAQQESNNALVRAWRKGIHTTAMTQSLEESRGQPCC